MTRVIVVCKSSFDRSSEDQHEHIEVRGWYVERSVPAVKFDMLIGRSQAGVGDRPCLTWGSGDLLITSDETA